LIKKSISELECKVLFDIMFNMEENLVNIQNIIDNQKKQQKRIKWIWIWFWLIIGFWISRLFSWVAISYITSWLWMEWSPSDVEMWILWIFSIFISLLVETLVVYIIIIWRTKKPWLNGKLKKYLKVSLIVLLLLSLLLCFALFTKEWKIRNWLNIRLLYPEEETKAIFMDYWCSNNYDSDSPWRNPSACVDKPIIYIYPIEKTKVNVILWTPENLLHTYPKYNPSRWWSVVAQPNGDLEDIDTWRKLYALYREWKSNIETNFDEWFVVAWKDTIPFLEEKLAILWLNEREAEEFIVYWLPQMEGNERNLIRFETKSEQDENMPLKITPTPDTVIRVMMDRKVIEEPIDIPEQQLTTPERIWFTVVEWWGSPRS